MNDATRLRIIVALAIEVTAFTFTALILVHGYAIGVSAVAASFTGLIAALTTRWTLMALVPAAAVAEFGTESSSEAWTEAVSETGFECEPENEAEERPRSRVKPVHIPQPAARPDYDRARPLR